MEKPTFEELKNYYTTNPEYFNELATYYYKTDNGYYAMYIAPFYAKPQGKEFVCPYCRQSMVPSEYSSPSMTVARITLFITSGFLFLVSLFLAYFFSVLFGLFFILISAASLLTGIFLNRTRKRCSKCGVPIPVLLLK